MEKENNLAFVLSQSILETNKSVKASNESLVANALRQTDIFEAQTILYRNTLILLGINMMIGFGILVATFITYLDKKEIATLHTQLRDRDEQIRLLQTKGNPPSENYQPAAATKIDTNR